MLRKTRKVALWLHAPPSDTPVCTHILKVKQNQFQSVILWLCGPVIFLLWEMLHQCFAVLLYSVF